MIIVLSLVMIIELELLCDSLHSVFTLCLFIILIGIITKSLNYLAEPQYTLAEPIGSTEPNLGTSGLIDKKLRLNKCGM